MNWMIYGATGYTGALIARAASQRAERPVLAGRSRVKVEALARELGLEWRAFELGEGRRLAAELRGVSLVLNCAGPFSATAAALIEACLEARAHYLDITGEIDVLEHAFRQNAAAERAGVVVCPGVGFDVVPTDCLASTLKQALPDATALALGFDSRSGLSPGTAQSSIEGLVRGNRVRKNGQLVEVPLAHRVRRIDFGAGERVAMTLPWGDVSTAYRTTGIPDIETFMAATPAIVLALRGANALRAVVAQPRVQSFLKARAARREGPGAAERAAAPAFVWGEVTNAQGETRTARIRTANGYDVTVDASLATVQALLAREQPTPGSTTPARLLGADFVKTLPGSGPLTLE